MIRQRVGRLNHIRFNKDVVTSDFLITQCSADDMHASSSIRKAINPRGFPSWRRPCTLAVHTSANRAFVPDCVYDESMNLNETKMLWRRQNVVEFEISEVKSKRYVIYLISKLSCCVLAADHVPKKNLPGLWFKFTTRCDKNRTNANANKCQNWSKLYKS